MGIFDDLPIEERDMMGEYIDRCVYSRSSTLKNIMGEWENKKENLYHAFGNNFILEKPVTYEISRDEFEANVNKVIHEFCGLINKVNKILIDLYYDGVIFDFLTVENIMKLFYSAVIGTNRYSYNDVSFEYNNKSFKLTRGTKPFRALSKLFDVIGLDTEELDNFRIKISQVFNQKIIKGTLCLSIHPLDYMTMSDNSENWTSCMSWATDGCYRQGTIEMMNSPMVVVGYVKSENKTYNIGASGDWNSKKWRELFIVNNKIITNCKPYPYCNMKFTRTCVDWLKEIVSNHFGWSYTTATEINCEGEEEESCFDYFDAETTYMYNDFDADAYRPRYFYHNNNRPYFNYSGNFVCMQCGCIGDIMDECEDGTLICDCCDGREGYEYYCEHCGDGIHEYETYWVKDNCYCSYCYDELPLCPILEKTYDTPERISIVDRESGESCGSIKVSYDVLFEEGNIPDYFKAIRFAITRHSRVLFAYLDEVDKEFYDDYSTSYLYKLNTIEEAVKSNNIIIVNNYEELNKYDIMNGEYVGVRVLNYDSN